MVIGYYIMQWAVGKSEEKWKVTVNEDGTKSVRMPPEVEKRIEERARYKAQADSQLQRVKATAEESAGVPPVYVEPGQPRLSSNVLPPWSHGS